MNIARIALLGVAVLAAGGAALLMRSASHKETKTKPVVAVIPAAEILVASHPLTPGAVLTPGDVRWQKWPQDGIAGTYMTHKLRPNAPADVAGGIVRERVDAGEPITDTKYVKGKNAGFMAALLSPGMRAISVKISEESAAGGFILPGDTVDVLSVHKPSEGAGQGAYNAETVLENVRVLAIGQVFEPAGNDKTALAKTATLELAPEQAELVAAAQAAGELTLALRSAITGDITGAIKPNAARGTVRLIRYGHTSQVSPAMGASNHGATR